MQTAIFPRINGKYKCVLFTDILYISANRNYSDIFTLRGQKITICSNLGVVESKLPDKLFSRVHRSYIISLQKIEEFDHNSILVAGREIPISKPYFDQLTKSLITFCSENEGKLREGMANFL